MTAAEGTPARILDAAASTLRRDPGASIEAIATAAGMSRATVHRHYPNRDVLVSALRERAVGEISATYERSRDGAVPLVVRLYQVTADLVSAKADWHWALGESEAAGAPNPVLDLTVAWMAALARGGLIADSDDHRWAATLYLTIIRSAATTDAFDGRDIATRASHAADAFLHGLGTTSVRYRD
ncbi:TetR/AcrR family transcriptional regulator [Gordonia sp. VNK1]|uniref:TetR/AcrR family transcriptional regulator n=1 Tax=Gordonia oleivorans TaxID=3156618 RepID=UPI0032B51E43